MCYGKAGLFCVLLCLASASSWAQDTSSSPATSTAQESNWDTLDKLLTELASEAQTLSDDSEKLQSLLDQARIELVKLQAKLAQSQTDLSGLSDSLKLSASSLATCAESLNRSALELWIWRGATVAALVACLVIALK